MTDKQFWVCSFSLKVLSIYLEHKRWWWPGPSPCRPWSGQSLQPSAPPAFLRWAAPPGGSLWTALLPANLQSSLSGSNRKVTTVGTIIIFELFCQTMSLSFWNYSIKMPPVSTVKHGVPLGHVLSPLHLIPQLNLHGRRSWPERWWSRHRCYTGPGTSPLCCCTTRSTAWWCPAFPPPSSVW